jgi:hypothetical protein
MSTTISNSNDSIPGVPLVVQLSFAGSRKLLDTEKHPNVDVAEFESKVQAKLTQRIEALRGELGLKDRHFFCGISQVAIGADTVFTRALQKLGICQRFFLPQHREEFLTAKGQSGKPDFTPEQQRIARELLDSPHIIQERVVGESADRLTRFCEVNMELARVADVIVCLLRAQSEGDAKSGGTLDMIDQANRRQCALLRIDISVDGAGEPQFAEQWMNREKFSPPGLPEEMRALQSTLQGVPDLDDYCGALRMFGSRQAGLARTFFKYAALAIIGTHFFATLCAVCALVWHNEWMEWLLWAELVLLASGFVTHWLLHHRRALERWSMSRLVAELSRSVRAMAGVRGYLSHLFALPLPDSLRPLRRTLSVLQMRQSRRAASQLFAERRDQYIRVRLEQPPKGQIPYYETKRVIAEFYLRIANSIFVAASACAFLATAMKLYRLAHEAHRAPDSMGSLLGLSAILLPVVAVASMSLAASHDLEARVSTYREMVDFLKKHKDRIAGATSDMEFAHLAIEAESRLLGETVTWYFRRSYTSVT